MVDTQASSHPASPTAESGPNSNDSLQRKGSFSFLRRSKSRDRSASFTTTPPRNAARKLSRKSSKKMHERELKRLREQIGENPPRIPVVPTQPEIRTFGGGEQGPDTAAIMSDRSAGSYPQRLAQKTSRENMPSDLYRGFPIPPVPPIPPIPGHTPTQGGFVIESMANRGRHSYASSAISTLNSPRRIRRRKDPTPFKYVVMWSRSRSSRLIPSLASSSLVPPDQARPRS